MNRFWDWFQREEIGKIVAIIIAFAVVIALGSHSRQRDRETGMEPNYEEDIMRG